MKLVDGSVKSDGGCLVIMRADVGCLMISTSTIWIGRIALRQDSDTTLTNLYFSSDGAVAEIARAISDAVRSPLRLNDEGKRDCAKRTTGPPRSV